MDDPHIICSLGARNCSNCYSICTDADPCACCGGDPDEGDACMGGADG